MELDGCGQEGGGDLGLHCQCSVHKIGREFLYRASKATLSQVLGQDVGVDREQRLLVGEAQGKHAEVTLGKQREKGRLTKKQRTESLKPIKILNSEKD